MKTELAAVFALVLMLPLAGPAVELAAAAQAEGGDTDARAAVRCTVQPNLTLGECVVLSEEPLGHGVGASALKLAVKFNIKPDFASVNPPGSTMTVPIRFKLDEAKQKTAGPVDKLGSTSQYESVADLKKAADAGNAVAENQLADKFQSGDGVEKDLVKAFCWAHRSAEHGFPNAWLSVALRYEMGTGVVKDNIESYKWFYILNSIPESAKDPQVSKWGKEDAAGISRQMTTDQINEAKRRADQWWKAVVARGHPAPNQMYVPFPGDKPSC